jgi:thiamine biosynthesis lipoprotein
VGIKHPRQKGFLGVLFLSQKGLATTGDYQRYFTIEGQRYHHVFNPKSGYPSKGKQSVTVIGPETVLCDALSTAIFVAPQPEDILQKFPDYGAVLVESSGEVALLGRSFSFQPLD